MASSRTEAQCRTLKKQLCEIVAKALKVYKEQEEAKKSIESVNSILLSCGGMGVSSSGMSSGLKDNMNTAEATALKDIKSWLNSVNKEIGKLIDELNVQDVQFMIDWLDGCDNEVKKLEYNNSISNMKGAGDIIKSAAEEWRYKVDNNAEFKEALLMQRRKAVEAKLAEDKARLPELEQKLQSEEEKYNAMIDNYVERKAASLKNVEEKFRRNELFSAETALEQELAAMNAALDAELALAQASAFGKKAAEESALSAVNKYKQAEQDYTNSLISTDTRIGFLPGDCSGYEQQIDAQKQVVDSLRSDIANCKCSISGNEATLKSLEV